MAFEDFDQSRQDSLIIELVTITTTGGGQYLYTSSDVDYAGPLGTYEAVPMMRSALELNVVAEKREMVVELPAGLLFCQQNLFGALPTQTRVKIERVQPDSVGDTTRLLWEGDMDTFNVENTGNGYMARLRIPSLLDTAIEVPVPNVYFQPQCNWVVYDQNSCKVAEASFQVATTVSTVSDKTITVASVSGQPDGYFRSGMVVRVSDGERRTIISHTGTTLILLHPFRVMTTTDAVLLLPGCDRTIQMCHTRFDNRPNFGGQPDIPGDFVVANRLITRRR